MFRNVFLFSILLAFTAKHSFSQKTIELTPSKDTYINSVISSKTQGSGQSLITACWTYNGQKGNGRSLIGFTMCEVPEVFNIEEAKLYLYHDPIRGHAGHTTKGKNASAIYQTTSNWDENTTWNTQPTYDQGAYTEIPSAKKTDSDYVIDVKNIVTKSLSESKEIGFYLKLNEEELYRSLVFCSKDHPNKDLRPKLVITYTSSEDFIAGTCGASNPVVEENNPVVEENNQVIWSSECKSVMRAPNVFTPNGDGKNDIFEITLDCPYKASRFNVFNRWGKLVYTSDSNEMVWDGRNSDNENSTDGTYFYEVEFVFEEKSLKKKGTITLMR